MYIFTHFRFSRIFDPNEYYTLQLHPNFLTGIFNSLILYYGDEADTVQPIV